MRREIRRIKPESPVEAAFLDQARHRTGSTEVLTQTMRLDRKVMAIHKDPPKEDTPIGFAQVAMEGGGAIAAQSVSPLVQIFGSDIREKFLIPQQPNPHSLIPYDQELYDHIRSTRKELTDATGDNEIMRSIAQKYDRKGSVPSRATGVLHMPSTKRMGSSSHVRNEPFKYPRNTDYKDYQKIMWDSKGQGGTSDGPDQGDLNGDGRSDTGNKEASVVAPVPVDRLTVVADATVATPVLKGKITRKYWPPRLTESEVMTLGIGALLVMLFL
jgi:hypothetical protein